MANESQTANTRAVDGAFGEPGPVGSDIRDSAENADHPNQMQPNRAIRVTPAPDFDEDLTVDGEGEWTGTRPGGEAPPAGSDQH